MGCIIVIGCAGMAGVIMDVSGSDGVIIVGGADIVAGGAGCIIVMPVGIDGGGGCACARGDAAGGCGCWRCCCGLQAKGARKEREETVSRWGSASESRAAARDYMRRGLPAVALILAMRPRPICIYV